MKIVKGVYKIENIVNKKLYIGSSNNVYIRLSHHKSMLKGNKHHNKYLQNDWNKYKEDIFIFSLLEKVEDETSLLNREVHWFDFYHLFEENNGYNILSTASRCEGRRENLSEEHKKSISKGLLNFYSVNESSKKGKNYPFKKISIEKSCEKCNKSFFVERIVYSNGEQGVSKKEKRFCSEFCASSRLSPMKGKTYDEIYGEELSQYKRKKIGKGVKKYNQKNPETLIKKFANLSGEKHPLFGKKGKNNPKFITLNRKELETIVKLYCEENKSITEIKRMTGISREIVKRELINNNIKIVRRNQFFKGLEE